MANIKSGSGIKEMYDVQNIVKTHSTMLRGYDDNRSIDRSGERHTAPSAINSKAKKKNRVSVFSDPKAYVLPPVNGSKHRN